MFHISFPIYFISNPCISTIQHECKDHNGKLPGIKNTQIYEVVSRKKNVLFTVHVTILEVI